MWNIKNFVYKYREWDIVDMSENATNVFWESSLL